MNFWNGDKLYGSGTPKEQPRMCMLNADRVGPDRLLAWCASAPFGENVGWDKR